MIDNDRAWDELDSWWVAELSDDPAYAEEVEPLVLSLLEPLPGSTYLDVGCGEGRLMRALAERGVGAVGVDLLQSLLASAPPPRVRLLLPGLGSLRSESFDGAYISLVIEHLADERTLLAEVARVTRPGGPVALVINHPNFTAPGSAPIQEPDEILWRPGAYFGRGHSHEPVGGGVVRFYHRTMADLLNSGAAAGLKLDRMMEIGVSDAQVERTPVFDGQRHIPRLLGVRWIRSST